MDKLIELFTDIATAIRNKKQTTEGMTASSFPEEIASITELKGEEMTITPTTEEQEITPSEDKNGITKVTVNAVTSDIDSNIVAENIKKDVAILGVTGTLEEGSGGTVEGIKQFATVEEMQADETAKEGDLAVVYADVQAPVQDGDTVTSLTFPSTVVLNEAITESYVARLRNSTSPSIYAQITLDETRFAFMDMYGTIETEIWYTSTDGITYNRTDTGESSYEFGETTITDVDEHLFPFLITGSVSFEGMYEYTSGAWAFAPNQLNATSDYVYNKSFYGTNGVEDGTLTIDVSNSFADVNAEVMCKIQKAYDDMEVRVLTDDDKAVDSNIYFIPTKSDGTVLLDTSSVTSMASMFANCTSLKTIPLLDTSSVTNMNRMLQNCKNLEIILLLNTSSVTDMSRMFQTCRNLKTIPLLNTSSVTDMSYMFSDCPSLETIPSLDTSSVTNMASMFASCENLETIPSLDTSSVTSMASMFANCPSLETIPSLDTSSVTNMAAMFANCTSLETIPLLNTSSVTNIYYMFQNCKNLKTIPLLNTSGVIDMNYMFSGCKNLKTIPSLDTSSVDSMDSMFANCTSLETIPSLDTSSVTNMRYMFSGCTSLTDEGLNNILSMCVNATEHTNNTALKYIGLTEEQAKICETLSNYDAFISAGWITGY